MQSAICKYFWALVFLSSGVEGFPQSNGGSYAITSSVVAGTGGTFTGGIFTVRGTLGQAVAGGPATNNLFSVSTGFWPAIQVVQTPGAPKLAIHLLRDAQGDRFLVSWPASTPHYQLQIAEALEDPINWSNSANPVVVDGGQNTVTFLMPPPSVVRARLFFRLMRKPE